MTKDELLKLIDEYQIPMEMFDFLEIIKFGADKYEVNDWLKPECPQMQHRNNSASLNRHFAAFVISETHKCLYNDKESGYPHLLHIATRALMAHTRQKLINKS